jgi:arylsulfatase A-like enzyme
VTGESLPNRPLDGVDLCAAFDGTLGERPNPLCFWEYNTDRLAATKPQPYLDPEQQKGTTPLAKLSGGKATRDFKNFRHPAISDADYLGSRAIISGRFKLVVQDQANGEVRRELFDLEADPAETTNLLDQQSSLADRLQLKLRDWQQLVLTSLTGADY